MFLGSIIIVVSVLQWTVKSANIPSLCCAAGDGKTYFVNTNFTTTDCKHRCVCTKDAHLGCVDLCPQKIIDCPVGYKKQVISELAGTKDRKCYCQKYLCTPIHRKNVATPVFCVEGNVRHKPGEEFIRNCDKRCRCLETGRAQCVSLCPNEKPCPVDHTVKNVLVPMPYHNRACKCKAKACKALPYKDECVANNRTYKSGDSFVSHDCASSCNCHPGGQVFCTYLCMPDIETCQAHQTPIKQQKKVLNTNCTCPIWRCPKSQKKPSQMKNQQVSAQLPNLNNHSCLTASGKSYLVGDVFTDYNCSSKCHCMNGGRLMCVPLCFSSSKSSSCLKQKIVQMPTLLPDAEGKVCSCPLIICEAYAPKPKIYKAKGFCEIDGKRHKIGKYFTNAACTGYCRCTGPKAYGCVSLCPPHHITCPLGTKRVKTVRPAIRGSKCTCPSWKCVKSRGPCDLQRRNISKAVVWPRCDDKGYYEPLQCDPSKNMCWCVDKLGNVKPGSKRSSSKPQC